MTDNSAADQAFVKKVAKAPPLPHPGILMLEDLGQAEHRKTMAEMDIKRIKADLVKLCVEIGAEHCLTVNVAKLRGTLK